MEDPRTRIAVELREALVRSPEATSDAYSQAVAVLGGEQASRLLLEVASSLDSSAVTG